MRRDHRRRGGGAGECADFFNDKWMERLGERARGERSGLRINDENVPIFAIAAHLGDSRGIVFARAPWLDECFR